MIDTHAHLSGAEMLPDIDSVLTRAKNASLEHIINICTDAKTLKEGLALEERYPWVHNAGSTTPHDVETEGEKYFKLFSQAALSQKLVAIGETGLDYYKAEASKTTQQTFLIRYLHLAARADLPIIFHCRDAFSDLFSIVDREQHGSTRAIVHCFTGSLEEAKKCIERGWFISFSGILTFKKSTTLREIARYIPLKYILLETDAPYLAPEIHRGKINEPSFLVETAACLAELKSMSLVDVAFSTSENARRAFNLPF